MNNTAMEGFWNYGPDKDAELSLSINLCRVKMRQKFRKVKNAFFYVFWGSQKKRWEDWLNFQTYASFMFSGVIRAKALEAFVMEENVEQTKKMLIERFGKWAEPTIIGALEHYQTAAKENKTFVSLGWNPRKKEKLENGQRINRWCFYLSTEHPAYPCLVPPSLIEQAADKERVNTESVASAYTNNDYEGVWYRPDGGLEDIVNKIEKEWEKK